MKKMVFIGGPRQVGKTTLCQMIGANLGSDYGYFNWDVDEDRKIIINKLWRKHYNLIIFDELHKFSRWKQWIKGLYDTKAKEQNYLVTGSARLDVYRRGGDSLLGRYHYWRLHPVTIDELPKDMDPREGMERLLSLGGFPEVFLQDNVREARRWRKDRFDRIIQEDIRDLRLINDIKLLRLYVEALQDRVGQLIILSNLAEDLQISPTTAKNWLNVIERMYIAFVIYPLTKNIPRSIQKPSKVYFYDNADVTDQYATRLENLVATSLLKRLHFIEDYYGYRCKLCYIRDKDSREVDFVTIIDGVVNDLIEVKSKDSKISSSLKYYANKLKPKRAIQIVGKLERSYEKDQILVVDPIEFFEEPPWNTISS